MPSYFTAPTHAASLAPEQTGSRDVHRVAIVGAGPVGMTLALCLARQGVPSVLIEAGDSVGFGSRAICISARSLEILAHCGVLDRVLDTAIPWTGGRTFYREREVLSFSMPPLTYRRPPMVNLQQCVLEQYMVDAVKQEQLIDLRWCTRLVGLEQQEDLVTLALESPLGDYSLHASWVIATDGPQSSVREMLGLSLQGETHEGRFVIVDLKLPSAMPAERLCWFDPPTFPGKTVLLHKTPFDIWRLDYQVDSDETTEHAVDPDRVLPLVADHLLWMGETTPWSLEWLSSYRAHSLTLEDYRVDRVLFAGDAAHLVPIFGVRGLNGGLVDALNLSWKLSAVINGAAASLLDSYTTEQRGAALANIAAASASARFMSPASDNARLLRDAALALALDHPEFRVLADPRQTVPIDYEGSDLSTPDQAEDDWGASPCPGALAPNSDVDGSSIQKLAGLRSALICFGPAGCAFGSTVACEDAVVIAVPGAGEIWETYDAHDGTVYLLRPDRHVAARWRQPALEALEAALSRATEGLVDARP
jgi:3-(3-hydroxy-phenyl)propionate hydroxylase